MDKNLPSPQNRYNGDIQDEEFPVINDPVLINEWHVRAPASELPEGSLLAVRLLGLTFGTS